MLTAVNSPMPLAHQRSAAGLAARVKPQFAGDRRRLRVVRVDHLKGDRDLLGRAAGQLELLEPCAVVGGEQPRALRKPVVVKDGLKALLPLAALIDERVTQTNPGAQLEQMVGRDPRLGQPADHQQLAQMARVGAIGLGALLVAAPCGGLGRLGKVDLGADRAQLLDHEAPPGCRLQCRLDFAASEPRQETANVTAVSRRHAGPADLAGLRIEPLGGADRLPLRSPYGASSSSK